MTPPSRIALLLPDLSGGGTERAIVRLASALHAGGDTVELVVGSPRGPLDGDLPSGVEVVDLDARRVRNLLLPLTRYLRGRPPAALLSVLPHANTVAVVARELARADTRLVVSVRTPPSIHAHESPFVVDRVLPYVTRFAYRRADAIVAVSEGVADDLAAHQRIPRERIRVVHAPIIGPDLLEQGSAAPGHRWFSTPGDPIVLAVGRLAPEKGFDTLLRAFARARRQRRARLLILGEGPARQRLESLTTDLGLRLGTDVDLPGFAANPYAAMRRADLFVLSSVREGMPNVLIEAAALGTPVVATDCHSGPREVLAGGRYGRLVPVGAVDVLAAAIADELEDPSPPPPAEALASFRVDDARDAHRAVLLGDPV